MLRKFLVLALMAIGMLALIRSWRKLRAEDVRVRRI